ncbi:MAG TPA: hypothetical protein VMW08_00285 [Acidimicrobiales bacterium]|nr:hypothetical protein [Acidimicrobiales bacterium]
MSLERKTPMRRDGEGARKFANQRSSLSNGGSNLKRTRMKPRSAKRSKVMADDRVPYIQSLIEAGVGCEIGPMLTEAASLLAAEGIEVRCGGHIEGLHERRKRSAGGSLTARENLIPACNWCNGLVEDEPRVVRELFGVALVLRPGDADYDRMGARADRGL